jgi:glycerol-3-phosphate acyltransferase PlsY
VTFCFVLGLLCYLVGSVPSGYIAGRIAGVDITKVGSGNIGATNVTRSLGKKFGYPVFIADFSKGVISVLIASRFATLAGPAASGESYAIVAAVSCVAGNAFPVWLGFRGGKGVAVSIGLLVALMPIAATIVVGVWVLTFYSTGFVSLASIVAAISLPIAVRALLHFGMMTGYWLFYISVVLASFVVWRHRSNISRLFAGTEQRFSKRGR